LLRWRLILGVAFAAALAALCWLDVQAGRPGAIVAVVALVIAALAAGELRRMYQLRGVELPASAVVLAAVLPVAVSSVPAFFPRLQLNPTLGSAGWLALGLAAALVASFVGEMRRFESTGTAIARVAHLSLAALYLGGMMGMLVQLRLVLAPGSIDGWRGLFPLLSTIATVKLSDIGQYVVGRTIGRRKLAPTISPGKTWEGAVGGIALATVVAALAMALVSPAAPGWRREYLWVLGAYASTVAVAGLCGDLAESLLKRDAGVKDSSAWMPGFGGVLDLLDSVLFAVPVAYVWWVSGLLEI
jgi:phosphatidate cytidylyltransferase